MDEESFGIIPLRKKNNGWEVLLVQLIAGHWSFPKGRAESEESSLQTAERELQEETGLKVKNILNEIPLTETYYFSRNNHRVKKTVTYFIGEVEGTLLLQAAEVQDAKWIPLQDVSNQITFSSAKALCRKILKAMEAN
jgi:bis(5'-nucleosidyl)-tetraphosphatase